MRTYVSLIAEAAEAGNWQSGGGIQQRGTRTAGFGSIFLYFGGNAAPPPPVTFCNERHI